MRSFPGLVTLLMFRLRLFAFWRLLPRALRRRIVRRIVRLPVRPAHPDRPARPAPPYTVLGFASSHTSLGWTTRALVQRLREEGHEPRIIDVSERFGSAHKAPGGGSHHLHDEPGTLIVNVNPNQVAYALAGLPATFLDRQYLVGSFVWELEQVPSTWLAPIGLMDEIWVPTRFVADAIARVAGEVPVRIVPYRIEVPPDIVPDRARFSLGADRFVVLVSANARSGLARKNVGAAVEAFFSAFPDQAASRASLVVKLHDAHLAPPALGLTLAGLGKRGVIVIRDDLDDSGMWRLVASCDAVLSMHRAEGYGLVLRQGLLLGKQVAATGWSGNLDFMTDVPDAHLIDYDFVPVHDPEGIYDEGQGLVWAEPDPRHAALVLRRMHEKWAGRVSPS